MENKYKIFLVLLATSLTTFAQQDTIKKKNSIDITSSFKPTLIQPSKINFSAAPPAAEPNKPVLSYNVPAQNLFFSYQPPPLKPLAIEPDTASVWMTSNYIKLGYGNFSTPFVQAAVGFGDGKNSIINLFGDYISSAGNSGLDFQDYNNFNIGANALFNTIKDHELNLGGKYSQAENFLYAPSATLPVFTKDQLRQRYTTVSMRASLKRTSASEYGIGYAPNLAVDFFSDNRDAKESNIKLTLPLTKYFGDKFKFRIGLTADVTNYTHSTLGSFKNDLYYIDPTVEFTIGSKFHVRAGVTPSWDNGKFNLMPNINVDFDLQEDVMQFQTGWIGYYQKNTFQRLANFNPWIAQPQFSNNQRTYELYGGIKGSIGSHFVYNAKASILAHYNIPLFNNLFGATSIGGNKNFTTFTDPLVPAFAVHGELGYVNADKFQLNSSLTITQYAAPDFFVKATGLLPLEWNTNLRWQLLKDFTLRIDAYMWDGAAWVDQAGNTRKLNFVSDLNLGLEFQVAKNINVWVQMNNLLNTKYERWNQYPVYGFNMLGGVVFSFGKRASN
jgi:hypothetical protein